MLAAPPHRRVQPTVRYCFGLTPSCCLKYLPNADWDSCRNMAVENDNGLRMSEQIEHRTAYGPPKGG